MLSIIVQHMEKCFEGQYSLSFIFSYVKFENNVCIRLLAGPCGSIAFKKFLTKPNLMCNGGSKIFSLGTSGGCIIFFFQLHQKIVESSLFFCIDFPCIACPNCIKNTCV